MELNFQRFNFSDGAMRSGVKLNLMKMASSMRDQIMSDVRKFRQKGYANPWG